MLSAVNRCDMDPVKEESLLSENKKLKDELKHLKDKRLEEQTSSLNLYALLLKLFSLNNSSLTNVSEIDHALTSIDEAEYSQSRERIEAQVKKEITSLAKSIEFASESIEKSIQSLSDKTDMGRNLKMSLEQYNSSNADFGITSKQSKLLKLLELYNVAFNELASKEQGISGLFSKNEIDQVCSSMQQIISEMDFPSSISDELTLIRYKLLSNVDPKELPKICVKILELVVASYRIERDDSQTFLTSLSESLNLFNVNFGKSISVVKSLHSSEVDTNNSIDLAINQIDSSIKEVDTIQQLKDNILAQVANIRQAMVEHHEIQDKQNNFVRAIEKIQDRLKLMVEETDEFKQKLAQQKHRLLIDSLTQLSNKNAYENRIDHEYKRWQRYGGFMTIALIDVDDFRAINEKFGHLAGDRALKVIARALQTKIRDTDFIARYTSDKFVVILLGTERKDIDIPLKKLNEIISSIPFHFKDNKVEITVSIGAAYFTENDNPVTVLEKAEQELSEAKKSGKNRFSIQ